MPQFLNVKDISRYLHNGNQDKVRGETESMQPHFNKLIKIIKKYLDKNCKK